MIRFPSHRFSSWRWISKYSLRSLSCPSNDLTALQSSYPHDFHILYDIIDENEETVLINHVNPLLKRHRYDGNHWDSVISKYKEIQLHKTTNPAIEAILDKCKTAIGRQFQRKYTYLPPHIIDLDKDGFIDPHVDSIKFSGELVAALSLLSSRWLTLTPSPEQTTLPPNSPSYHVMLPRRSIYMLRGPLRYDYAHAVLGENKHGVKESDDDVLERRISIMFRDEHAASSR